MRFDEITRPCGRLWIIAVLTLISAGAFAHGGATGIVKQRMDAMDAISDATKSLAAMMRGIRPYDADAVSEAAATVRSHAGAALTGLFPEGSLHRPSEARPEIWSDWSEFQALAMRLSMVAAGLEQAAGNGLAQDDASTREMAGQTSTRQLAKLPPDTVFKMLARTCSDCHGKFRVKKD